MSQQTDLTIEFESNEQVESVLSDSVRKGLKNLTIQIYDNLNTWYSYGRIPWQSEEEKNMPSFRIKHPVDSLPWLGGMPNLESLTLKFLGLQYLPKEIDELKNLKNLDISFNFIKISDELDQLKALENLEELIVFGLRLTKSDREELTDANHRLNILYTQEQDIELAKKRRKEK